MTLELPGICHRIGTLRYCLNNRMYLCINIFQDYSIGSCTSEVILNKSGNRLASNREVV